MMLVEHILPTARKRPVTVEGDAPILQAAALLSVPHVSLVIVCDAAGAAIGVISKADIETDEPLRGSRLQNRNCQRDDPKHRCLFLPRLAERCLVNDETNRHPSDSDSRRCVEAFGNRLRHRCAPCLVNGSAGSTTIAERLRDVRRISLIFRFRTRDLVIRLRADWTFPRFP